MSAHDTKGVGMLGWVVLRLIRLYQLTPKGPVPRCRFLPSCSEYATDAIRVHGTMRGVWLGARRVLRCQPWNPGGIDPVPASVSGSREEVVSWR